MDPKPPAQPAKQEKQKGRVITFYSYKGGTGRTMLLANVAWILASNKKRVLVVDWDLEAPGLHRYYRPFLGDPELTSSPGVIDLVTDDAVEAMTSPPEGQAEGEGEGDRDASILPFASSLRWSFSKPGTIDFVPAGKQGPTYAARVNSFNWQNYYDRLGGGAFLDAVRESMIEEYDYVLIDSRTGVSDTAGICTVQIPDSIVVCFTLNNQSIEGASAIARSVLAQRTEPGFHVYPVPTRVEDGEKRKLERARDHAHRAFHDMLDHVDPAKIEQYWSRVEVPYKIFYAYEEILATFGDRPEQLNSLLASAERLTGYLTGGEITRLVPPTDEERRNVLGAFERGQKKPEAAAVKEEKKQEEPPPTKRPAEVAVSTPPPPSEPGRTSWRGWRTGGALLALACGLVAVGRYSHELSTGPVHGPVSSADAGVEPDDPVLSATPPPASAAPSAIVAVFDKQKDPVDQVALLRSLPESPPPPANVVEVAAELTKGPLPIAVLRGHTQDLVSVRFVDGNKRLVTSSNDGTVRIWASDGSGEGKVLDWGAPGDRRIVSLDVTSGLVAASTEDGEAHIWLADGESFPLPLSHLLRGDNRRSVVRFSADGNSFMRAFAYGQVHLWKIGHPGDGTDPGKIGVLVSSGVVQDVAMNADGSVITRAPDKMTAWKAVRAQTTPEQLLRAGTDWSDTNEIVAALSPFGDGVVVAGSDGQLRWWHAGGGAFEKPPLELKRSGTAVTAVALYGDRCAFGTADGGVYLWKRPSPKSSNAKPTDGDLVQLGAHKGRVSTIAFGKDGRSLVTAGADGVARVFNLDAGGQPIQLGQDGSPRLGGAWPSDDGKLVVTMVGKTAQVWRLNPPAPASAPPSTSWSATRNYLRSTSNVELSDDRMREILMPGSGGRGKPQKAR